MAITRSRNLNRIACGMPPECIRTHALVRDINSIKINVATNVADQTYTAATLDGVLANPGPALIWLPMTVSVTTSAAAGAYHIVAPIVFTGLDEWGVAQTENIQLTAAGGGEFLLGALAWTRIDSIFVPNNHDATGLICFGTEDILPKLRCTMRSYVAWANGNLGVQNPDGSVDAVPINAAQLPLKFLTERIRGATTTAVPISVLYDQCM